MSSPLVTAVASPEATPLSGRGYRDPAWVRFRVNVRLKMIFDTFTRAIS
jgi:hypothetical protein